MNQQPAQADLLASYWAALAHDPDAAPPAGLDLDLAAQARQMETTLHPPAPDTAFAEALRRRLAPKRPPAGRSRPRYCPRAPGRMAQSPCPAAGGAAGASWLPTPCCSSSWRRRWCCCSVPRRNTAADRRLAHPPARAPSRPRPLCANGVPCHPPGRRPRSRPISSRGA